MKFHSIIGVLPGPQLGTAIYSSSADRIFISFNTATNRGGLSGNFDCRLLFTADFEWGTSTYCTWANSSIVIAYMDSLSTDSVGKNLTIIGNVRDPLGNSDKGSFVDIWIFTF